MKNVTLVLLLLVPFLLFAQADDYCPCQETKKEYEDIYSFISSVNSNNIILVKEQPSTAFVPPSVRKEEPIVIPIPKKEEPEPQIEEKQSDQEADAPISDSNTEMRRSSTKKSKKRWKTKVKRSKKARKYKGKCPFF